MTTIDANKLPLNHQMLRMLIPDWLAAPVETKGRHIECAKGMHVIRKLANWDYRKLRPKPTHYIGWKLAENPLVPMDELWLMFGDEVLGKITRLAWEYRGMVCSGCGEERTGAHYNMWSISDGGVAGLRMMFPEGKANDMNFALFSTSGVHGTYTTIEEIEASLLKYGADPEFLKDDDLEEKIPEDWAGTSLTVAVYHPRIIGVGYGNVEVKLEDIPFLKRLRETSWAAVQKIGASE
jgi:hypothetical protein